jgi:hypothetical protein
MVREEMHIRAGQCEARVHVLDYTQGVYLVTVPCPWTRDNDAVC